MATMRLKRCILVSVLAVAAVNAVGHAGTRVNWAAVNAASRQIDAAKAELREAANQARRQVESSAEFAEAVTALREAHANHRRAVNEALATVEASREFIELDLQLQAAVKNLQLLHDQFGTTDAQIIDGAHVVMAIRAEMTQLRGAALEANLEVEAARYAMIDAGIKVRALREDARSRVTQSPAWQAARQRLNAARQQYASAG